MLLVACCLLCVVVGRCLLLVVRCLLSVVCRWLLVVCGLLFVDFVKDRVRVCCSLRVVRRLLFVLVVVHAR